VEHFRTAVLGRHNSRPQAVREYGPRIPTDRLFVIIGVKHRALLTESFRVDITRISSLISSFNGRNGLCGRFE
jgi:hypothetical protein